MELRLDIDPREKSIVIRKPVYIEDTDRFRV